jgi:hypothetical protein
MYEVTMLSFIKCRTPEVTTEVTTEVTPEVAMEVGTEVTMEVAPQVTPQVTPQVVALQRSWMGEMTKGGGTCILKIL